MVAGAGDGCKVCSFPWTGVLFTTALYLSCRDNCFPAPAPSSFPRVCDGPSTGGQGAGFVC